MTHTPGPWMQDGPTIVSGHWTVGDDPSSIYFMPGMEGFLAHVAYVAPLEWPDTDGEMWRAPGGTPTGNALLIAAAPDLLTALENMVALAEPHFSDDAEQCALDEARTAIAKARGEDQE